jgi:hypothetical protein
VANELQVAASRDDLQRGTGCVRVVQVAEQQTNDAGAGAALQHLADGGKVGIARALQDSLDRGGVALRQKQEGFDKLETLMLIDAVDHVLERRQQVGAL